MPVNHIRSGLLTFFVSFLSIVVVAQKPAGFDSSYYRTFPGQITGRVYFSQKYARLALDAPGAASLKYTPNNPFAIGVGVTYGIATLNLGLGLPAFVDQDKKGKTKILDLQSHIYARKWLIDLYGEFYKGYYLSPEGKGTTANNYYIRPDIKLQMIGASAYHIFNSRRFSYRASFLQDEWQHKSAGNFLLGGEVYFSTIKGDSALAPSSISNPFSQTGIYKANFIEFGPGAGYAYTLVLGRNFFITASGTVNADLSLAKERSAAAVEKKTGISPNFTLRGAVGYNSANWIVIASWVENNLRATASDEREYMIRTGNYRFTIAKRIIPAGKLKRKLSVIKPVS